MSSVHDVKFSGVTLKITLIDRGDTLYIWAETDMTDNVVVTVQKQSWRKSKVGTVSRELGTTQAELGF